MNPQITINISVTPDQVTISQGSTSIDQEKCPQPLPLEELTVPTTAEVELIPQPLPLEELEKMANSK
jgi:hypothetical protein